MFLAAPGASAVAGTDSWTVTSPSTSPISTLAVSPGDSHNVVALGTTGFFRSTDAGASWTRTSFGPTPTSVAIDPANPQVVFAAVQGVASWRSTDGGQTWNVLGGPNGSDVTIDPLDGNRVYLDNIVSGISVLYFSSDMGTTWQPRGLPAGSILSPVAIDPATGDAYIGTTAGVERSSDDGNTWTMVSTQRNDARRLAFDPGTPGRLYAGGWIGGLCVSGDDGAGWSHVDSLPGTLVSDVVVDPSDSQHLIVVVDDTVQVSTDGGATWTPATGLPPSGALEVDLDPGSASTVYAATGDGTYRSTDGGASFASRTAGMVYGDFSSIEEAPSDSSVLYATSLSGGVFVSVDDGSTWTQRNSGLPSWEASSVTVDPSDPNTAFVVVHGTVYVTNNGGGHWSDAGLASTSITALVVDSTGSGVYAASPAGGIYASADGGATWAPADAGLASLRVTALAIDPSTPSTLYAATEQQVLYRSIDSGASWQPLPLNFNGSLINRILVAPSDPNTIYAGYHVSKDGGATWTQLDTAVYAVDPADAATVYTISASDVRVSHQYGTAWWFTLGTAQEGVIRALLVDQHTPGRLLSATAAGLLSEDMVPPAPATDPAAPDSDGLQATLLGHVDGNGFTTHYAFQWGTTTAYTEYDEGSLPLSQPSGATSVSMRISGLTPGTTYHYRVVAWNSGGVSYSPDATFRTPVPPEITALPMVGFMHGTVTSAGAPARVTWAGDGGDDPLCSYQMRQWINGRAGTAAALPDPAVAADPTTIAPGEVTYAVRATDCTGEHGPYLQNTQRISFLGDGNPSIVYHGGWITTPDARDLGGTAATTTRLGATAQLSFTGTSIAWVSTRSPQSGSVSIAIDGVAVRTADLNRPITQRRRVIFAETWPASAAHTITITNLDAGKLAVVDGLLLVR